MSRTCGVLFIGFISGTARQIRWSISYSENLNFLHNLDIKHMCGVEFKVRDWILHGDGHVMTDYFPDCKLERYLRLTAPSSNLSAPRLSPLSRRTRARLVMALSVHDLPSTIEL